MNGGGSPPEADRFSELRPFYPLCELGLLLTALNLVLFLGMVGGVTFTPKQARVQPLS